MGDRSYRCEIRVRRKDDEGDASIVDKEERGTHIKFFISWFVEVLDGHIEDDSHTITKLSRSFPNWRCVYWNIVTSSLSLVKIPIDAQRLLISSVESLISSAAASISLEVNIRLVMTTTTVGQTILAVTWGVWDSNRFLGKPSKPANLTFMSGFNLVDFLCDGPRCGINEQCSICMEEFEEGSMLIKMPCSHLGHVDFLRNWLRCDHVCPICRCQFPEDPRFRSEFASCSSYSLVTEGFDE